MHTLRRFTMRLGFALALLTILTVGGGALQVSAAPATPERPLVDCTGYTTYETLYMDSGLKTFNQGARTIYLEAATYKVMRSFDNSWCGTVVNWFSGKCTGSPCVGTTIYEDFYRHNTDGSWTSVQHGSWNLANSGVTETRTMNYIPLCTWGYRPQTTVSATPDNLVATPASKTFC